MPLEHYHTTWITDRTHDYLVAPERHEKPFFAWVSYIKPHHPFDPPAPYDTRYAADEVLIPSPTDGWQDKPLLTVNGDPREAYFDTRSMTEAQLRTVIAHYYGLISQIDDSLGRLVATLKAHNLYDNTLLVFTSDHGDYLGQYGLFLKHPNVPYDALAQVPLILSGGALETAPQRSQALVSLIDLFPTLLALANVTYDVRHQGLNMLSVLDNPEMTQARSILIETEGAVRGVRYGRYKYLYDEATDREELYDLQIDPHETTNLAPDISDVIHLMRLKLLKLMIDCCWDRHAYTSQMSGDD